MAADGFLLGLNMLDAFWSGTTGWAVQTVGPRLQYWALQRWSNKISSLCQGCVGMLMALLKRAW